MNWWIVITAVALMLFVWIIHGERKQKEKYALLQAKQKLLDEQGRRRAAEFEPSWDQEWPVRHQGRGERYRDYIMMSGDQRRLRFIGAKFIPEFELRRDEVIAVEDIVTVELQQSSETIMRYETTTTTKQGAPLMRAAVGGLAFGGAGAVVGAVSAKKTSTGTATGRSETRKGPIYLVIGTTDIHNPMIKHTMPDMTTAESWLHRIRGAIAATGKASL